MKLITGTSFIVIGIVVLVVAAIRRRAGGVRAVFLLGVWVAIYGIQRLNDCDFLIELLPHWMQVCVPYSHALITYLTLVAAALTFRELTVGKLRHFVTLQAPHRSCHRCLRHRSFRVDRRRVLPAWAEQFSRRQSVRSSY